MLCGGVILGFQRFILLKMNFRKSNNLLYEVNKFALKCYSFLIFCNRKFDLVTVVISYIILVTFTNLANFIFAQLLAVEK